MRRFQGLPSALLLAALALLLGLPRCQLADVEKPLIIRVVEELRETLTEEERADPLIVSVANSGFHCLVHWWVLRIQQLGIRNFVVIALDAGERDLLLALNVTVVYYNGTNLNHGPSTFQNPHYNKILAHRWTLFLTLLEHGYDFVHTDMDIFWRRNPLPYFRTLPYCHMYFAADPKDLPLNESSPLQPKPPRLTPPFPRKKNLNSVCNGFVYLRAVPEVIDLSLRIIQHPVPGKDDQTTMNAHLNAMFHANRAISRADHGPDGCTHYGNLTLHILRPDLFQNRLHHHFFVDVDYYNVHFNWLAHYAEKLQAMEVLGFLRQPECTPADPSAAK